MLSVHRVVEVGQPDSRDGGRRLDEVKATLDMRKVWRRREECAPSFLMGPHLFRFQNLSFSEPWRPRPRHFSTRHSDAT
jgi:hypothetical protein